MTVPSRRDVAPAGKALVAGAAVTLAWHLVLFAVAFGLPSLSPGWFPDLGATLVNLIALLVPLAVVTRLRWWSRRWVAFAWPRRPLLLLPVLAVALSYGLAGIHGSATVLVASAVLFLALGSARSCSAEGWSWSSSSPSARASVWRGSACCSGWDTPSPPWSSVDRWTTPWPR